MDRSLTVWHRLLEHADLSVSPASSPDDIPEDDPIEDGPGSQSSVHLEEDNHEQQKPRRLHLKRHIDDRGNGRGILVHGSMFLCPKPTSSGSGRPPSQSPVDDGFDSIERQLSSRKRSGSKVRIVSLRYSKALDISDKPAQPVEWASNWLHDGILDDPTQRPRKAKKRSPSKSSHEKKKVKQAKALRKNDCKHQLQPKPLVQVPQTSQPGALQLMSWWNVEDLAITA